jgi:2-amino-4-hydroxy-6-hydroxymethyldihydropteridine diphosphokinase
MGARAWISLGSNQGDRRAILDGAILALRESPGIALQSVSSYRETLPVGGPAGQGAYLNAAAGLETELEPRALLQVLQEVEARFGRVRSARWGARTLDLDLLLYGSRVVDRSDLSVPHLRMAVRRFVLAPLAEIAADVIDPITRRSVSQLLANLEQRPSYVAIRSDPQSDGGDPVFRLVVEQLGGIPLCANDRLRHEDGSSSAMADPTAWLIDQLSPERRASLGDRWLVSDFIPRELLFDAALRQNDDDTPRFEASLRPFLAIEPQLLAPTFLVEGRPIGEGGRSRSPAGTWRRPSGGFAVAGSPCIHLEGFSTEAMADEILATCQAVRT